MHLLDLLRNKGLNTKQLGFIAHSIIIWRIRYVLPAWSGSMSVDLIHRVDTLLKVNAWNDMVILKIYCHGVIPWHCLIRRYAWSLFVPSTSAS